MRPDKTPGRPAEGLRITVSPVTGLPQEPGDQDLRAPDLDPLDRACQVLLSSASKPEQWQAAFQVLGQHDSEPRVIEIVKNVIENAPRIQLNEDSLPLATDLQILAAIFLIELPGSEDAVKELLSSKGEPTARSAILTALRGSEKPEYRAIFVSLLKDDSELVKISALSALVNQDMTHTVGSQRTPLQAELSGIEAIAEYLFNGMRLDFQRTEGGCKGIPDRRIREVQDLLIRHLENKELLAFAKEAALDPKYASEACTMLARIDEDAMRNLVADSYERNIGTVRESIFPEYQEKEGLRALPNRRLEEAIEKAFLSTDSTSNARGHAFDILAVLANPQHHALFCEVFARRDIPPALSRDLANKLQEGPAAAAMQAAVAVLNTPDPTFLEKIGTQFRAVFGPKKFHLAEDSPAERHQAHAIDVLRCGEHPLKDKALRCALRSDCQNVRWHAAVALGAQDRGVQAVIRKLPKSAFQDRIRGCLNHSSPEIDKLLVEVDSALILGVLKKIVQETPTPKDLERIGDLFAERINAGHTKEVGVLIDYLKLSSSIGKGLPQHFSTIVDRVCLRAFSQVLELLPNELDDLAAAIEKANFSGERERYAIRIVANLRKAQEKTASQE